MMEMIVATKREMRNLVLPEHNPTFHTVPFTSVHFHPSVIQLAHAVGEDKGKVFVPAWAVHFASVCAYNCHHTSMSQRGAWTGSNILPGLKNNAIS